MERGDKVWVTYGGGQGYVPKAYKARLLGKLQDGRWVVREVWTLTKRVIRESDLSPVGKDSE